MFVTPSPRSAAFDIFTFPVNKFIQQYKSAYSGITPSVWVLAAVQLINRSGSMVLPFMTVYMTASLGYSKTEAGIIMSFFGVGSMVGSYFGGRLTDKMGPFRVQMFSLFGGGLTYFMLIGITNFYWLAAGVFLCAMVNESMRPANSSMASHFATPETTTRSFSLLRMAVNLGVAIGPAVAGMLAHISYTWLFVGDGVTNLAAGAVFYFHFRHKQPQYHKKEHPAGARARSPYSDSAYLLFLIFCLLYAVAFFQIFSGIPLYYKDIYHKPESAIGLLLGFNGLIVFFFEMGTVSFIEKRAEPRKLIFIGSAMLAVSLVMLNMAQGNAILIISMILMSFSEMFAMPFMISHVVKRSTERTRGSYLAAYTIVWSLSLILSPFCSTQLIERFSFDMLWWVMGGICMITAFGFMRILKNTSPTAAIGSAPANQE